MEERLVPDEGPGTKHRRPVAVGLVLGDHLEAARAPIDGCQKRRLIPGPDDDGDLIGPGGERLVNDDAERRTDHAIPIDEPLKGMLLGRFSGSGDHGAAEIHGGSVGRARDS